MKNFKEMLDKDLETTFFNTKEFAEMHNIKCDGVVKNIPVIFDLEETKDRNNNSDNADNAEGIYQRYKVIRVQLKDMGKEPRQGMRLFIDSDLYIISAVDNQYNELIIDLERYDE